MRSEQNTVAHVQRYFGKGWIGEKNGISEVESVHSPERAHHGEYVRTTVTGTSGSAPPLGEGGRATRRKILNNSAHGVVVITYLKAGCGYEEVGLFQSPGATAGLLAQ